MKWLSVILFIRRRKEFSSLVLDSNRMDIGEALISIIRVKRNTILWKSSRSDFKYFAIEQNSLE